MIMNRILSIAILFILAFNVSYAIDKEKPLENREPPRTKMILCGVLPEGWNEQSMKNSGSLRSGISRIGFATEGPFALGRLENPFRKILEDMKNADYLVYAALYIASLNVLIASQSHLK